MRDPKVEKEFAKHTRKLVKLLGVKATTDTALNKKGKELFGAKFKGCHSQDEKIKFINGFYIINTDISSGEGEHWVALYLTSQTAYIFDSFGRPTQKLLTHLTKTLRTQKIKILDSDPDQDQSKSSQICGVLCLAWFCVIKNLGIRQAMKI